MPEGKVATEFPLAGASKKGTGKPGRADIVAYDPITNTYYLWEVKCVGGDHGELGAESEGPADIGGYITAMRAQFEAAIGDMEIEPARRRHHLLDKEQKRPGRQQEGLRLEPQPGQSGSAQRGDTGELAR
jgi:hypothetical protein